MSKGDQQWLPFFMFNKKLALPGLAGLLSILTQHETNSNKLESSLLKKVAEATLLSFKKHEKLSVDTAN